MKIRGSPIGIRSFLHYTRLQMRYFYMYVGEIKKVEDIENVKSVSLTMIQRVKIISVKFP